MITVGLVEDEATRELVRDWLDRMEEFQVTGCATTVPGLVAGSPRPPDVVVLDVTLHDDSDFADNIRRLQKWGTQVIVYTSDVATSGLRVTAFQMHVLAFLQKRVDLSALVEALRRVPSGEQQMTEEWSAHLGEPPVSLTPTEHKVMRLYASGMTYEEISAALGKHTDTGRKHIARIREKYRQAGRPSQTRAELTAQARRDGHLLGP